MTLSIEQVVAPTENGLSIVSLREMRLHLRIFGNDSDEDIAQCVLDAAATMHGRDGFLNRTLFPTTWRRFLTQFPACGKIELPMPPLISVDGITYDSQASPATMVDPAIYRAITTTLVGSVNLLNGKKWPSVTANANAIAIEYTAGYQAYPKPIRRAVKLLAAHFFENREATYLEDRQQKINRALQFGLEWLTDQFHVPSYGLWTEDVP